MSKNKKNCTDGCVPERLGKVGGQAVLEGVMMKAGDRTVTTCRKEDGSIVVNDALFSSVRKKNKLLSLPIIRGVVSFIESMVLSVKTLGASADAMGIEDEEGKVEKWMKKHLGIRITDVVMIIGTVLGVALSLFLFMYLPNIAAEGIDLLLSATLSVSLGVWRAVVEGVVKVIIFITYLYLVSLIPDIKRTFMYHGAEHKTIACYEAGAELTPENAKEYKRFHPRCGTSFMFFMILLGIVVGIVIRYFLPEGFSTAAYTGIRLLVLPLVMGIGYEYLMYAGKHNNVITRMFSAPGLWVQRITTKEPTADMLEIAIISTKCALRDVHPEFMEFYNERSWGELIVASEKNKEQAEAAEVTPEAEGEQATSIENEAQNSEGEA